jgi:hypothetical protein
MIRTRYTTTCWVFDIDRAIQSLGEPPLADTTERTYREFIIDGFVKHTISRFDWVSVRNHYPVHFSHEVVQWFEQQTIAIQELYQAVRFRPEDAGSQVFIHRMASTIWVFVPQLSLT